MFLTPDIDLINLEFKPIQKIHHEADITDVGTFRLAAKDYFKNYINNPVFIQPVNIKSEKNLEKTKDLTDVELKEVQTILLDLEAANNDFANNIKLVSLKSNIIPIKSAILRNLELIDYAIHNSQTELPFSNSAIFLKSIEETILKTKNQKLIGAYYVLLTRLEVIKKSRYFVN